MELCNVVAMFTCERCGKSLINIVDLLLLLLCVVNLVFGVLILMMGSWFGITSFFLAILFGAAFAIRRRECKYCAVGRTQPGKEK